MPPAGQRRRAIEDPDVVQAQEPALEQVAVIGVLAVHPPGEVRQQPVEHPRQELAVALTPDLRLALVHVQRRPRRHRRVHIAEVPLIRRHLAVRMQIPGAEQQLDLRLREVDVDQRQRRAMKREIPRREPRILPLVRHRDHIARDHVKPRHVAHRARGGIRAPRVDAVLAQPPMHVVLVVLLAPQQPRQRLAHHHRPVLPQRRGDHRRVELIGLLAPRFEHPIEVRAQRLSLARHVRLRAARRRQAHANRGAVARRHLQHVIGRDLGPRPLRIDRLRLAGDDALADPILDIRRSIGNPEQTLVIGLVLAEQQPRRRVRAQHPLAQLRVRRTRRGDPRLPVGGRQRRLRDLVTPRPRVPEPQRRQQMQRRRVRARGCKP